MNFPQFELKITSSCLIISSPRLDSPITLEYEHKKKSIKLYLDFLLINEGLSLYSNRLRVTRFLQFTHTGPLPEKCFFRLTNGLQDYSIPLNSANPARYFLKLKMDSKGNFLTIEHGKLLPPKEKKPGSKKNHKLYTMVNTVLAFLDLIVDDKSAAEHFKENFKKAGGSEFEEFLDLLSMGTTFITKEQREIFERNQETIQQREVKNESIKSLLDTISAVAAFIQFLIPSPVYDEPPRQDELTEPTKLEPEDI